MFPDISARTPQLPGCTLESLGLGRGSSTSPGLLNLEFGFVTIPGRLQCVKAFLFRGDPCGLCSGGWMLKAEQGRVLLLEGSSLGLCWVLWGNWFSRGSSCRDLEVPCCCLALTAGVCCHGCLWEMGFLSVASAHVIVLDPPWPLVLDVVNGVPPSLLGQELLGVRPQLLRVIPASRHLAAGWPPGAVQEINSTGRLARGLQQGAGSRAQQWSLSLACVHLASGHQGAGGLA